MPLTDLLARSAKPRAKTYKLSDSKGLYLQVEPNGSKLWRLKYRFNGRERRLAFGMYPEVTLSRARERQIEARRVLSEGIDPGELKKQAKRSAAAAHANTFEAVAREWFVKHASGWVETHSEKVLLRLENELFPWLGSRPVAAIEASELLEALRRVEARGAPDTAHRCLAYANQIFRYAVATARGKENPAANLRGALPPAQGGHLPSITEPAKVGSLLRAIDGYEGAFVTKCALRLAPLTFVRPGELRTADWTHFDLDEKEWCIPAERMKMRDDLIVPLSRQAIEILAELKPATGNGRYLFPCLHNPRGPMSNNTINAALRRLGYARDEMTGHGFRAMARTLLDEVLEFRVEWIEHQLAHTIKDPNGRAYNRTSFLEGRKKMMQAWADYLDELRSNESPATHRPSNRPRRAA